MVDGRAGERGGVGGRQGRARRRARALGLACLTAAWAGPAAALVGDLTPAGIEQAEDAGTRGMTREDFDQEWHLRLSGGEEIVVSTPFSRLALAARQAAIKGELLTPRQRQEQIDRGLGRIQLLVTLYGKERTFARWYQASLVVGRKEIKANFVQNERTPLRLEDGRYAARNVYVFPLEELPGKGSVTLVIRDAPPESREVLRAPIDLARFR
jgi:hypothetical protein